MIARVVTAKLSKTVTVLIESEKTHPLYKKTFIRSKKYLVHDPIGVKEGDLVEIVKIAPVSKRKHFQVAKIVGKNLEEVTEAKLKEHAKGVIEEVMPEDKEEEKTERADEENKGGKQTKVVADDLAEKTKSKSKTRTKSVRNK